MSPQIGAIAQSDLSDTECLICGEIHRACKAHNRRHEPCGKVRMKGQQVCASHGGASRHSRNAGLRRVELEKAVAKVRVDIAHRATKADGVVDPLAILAELAAEAIAMKDALASRVNALSKLRYRDSKGSEQLRAEVVLYERALDRSARFVEVLAKSGFEEARVKLEQDKGKLVAYVIKRILDQLELTEQQRTIVSTVVPTELRRLSGEKDVSR